MPKMITFVTALLILDLGAIAGGLGYTALSYSADPRIIVPCDTDDDCATKNPWISDEDEQVHADSPVGR